MKEKQIKLPSERRKEIIRCFNKICTTRNRWEVWQDMIFMFSCCMQNPIVKALKISQLKDTYEIREKEYLRTIKKYNKEQQELFPEILALITEELKFNKDQDLLGSLYMELELGNKNNGQFFTPYDVCKMMAEITIDKPKVRNAVKERGWCSLNDCACGGGATLIAGVNVASGLFKRLDWHNHLLVYAQDIDATCCQMAHIQFSLLGIPAIIKHGNSLTNPEWNITKENQSSYYFTPMYFSEVWTTRRLLHGFGLTMNKLFRKENKDVENES